MPLALLYGLVAVPFGAGKADSTAEPPIVGRPADFSGAVGSYRIRMQAVPTELQAEDPLVLTVRITGSGSLQSVPRPDLRGQPRFTQLFHIEDAGERYLADVPAREFDYRLRPRSAAVKEVPRLSFVYFKPGIIPDSKGYQTTMASAIPLTVTARAAIMPSATRPTVHVPERFYTVTTGSAVLHGRPAWWYLMAGVGLMLLFAAPPVVCLLWYTLWRRRHPDAARLAHMRQSRAAGQALRALRKAGTAAAPEGVLSILVDYLRQRFGLPPAEPTPAEAAAHLEKSGTPAALVQRLAALLRKGDAARFAPHDGRATMNWSEQAAELIIALEAGPWPLPSS